MKKPKAEDATPEIKCDACGGAGRPSVKAVAPGRQIHPVRCTKCGGKGRLSACQIQQGALGREAQI